METGLSFGQAIEAAKDGKLISREGWNGKGMFVFQRPADELPYQMVVDTVKSLPKSVKDYFQKKATEGGGFPKSLQEMPAIKFTAYLCMYAADGTIVNGWLASQTDMLSSDWCILGHL